MVARWPFALLPLLLVPHLWGAVAKDLRLEYRRNAGGVYAAILKNQRASPVTAYIADASFQEGFRERHTALGGDTLGFTNGEENEIPPAGEIDAGRPLPGGATPGVSRVLAAIYADGTTEGEDDVVAMLLAGRHRAYADLKESIAKLEAATGPESIGKLAAFFNAMQVKDQRESEALDELEDAPGRMRYRFFSSAVPTVALQHLQAGGNASGLLPRFRTWMRKLADSKPDVK